MKKKIMEFSQRIVVLAYVCSIIIVVLALAGNFVLSWRANMPMTQETVAAITTYGGVTSVLSLSAYSALTAVRSWSRNKHCNNQEDEP